MLVPPRSGRGVGGRSVEMRARPLQVRAASAQQAPAPRAADATSIAIDRVAGFGVAAPPPPAALQLQDVRAHADGVEGHQGLGAVIDLVGDEFGPPVALGMHCFDRSPLRWPSRAASPCHRPSRPAWSRQRSSRSRDRCRAGPCDAPRFRDRTVAPKSVPREMEGSQGANALNEAQDRPQGLREPARRILAFVPPGWTLPRRRWSRRERGIAALGVATAKRRLAPLLNEETEERKPRSDGLDPRKRRGIGDDEISIAEPDAAALRANQASDADVGARQVAGEHGGLLTDSFAGQPRVARIGDGRQHAVGYRGGTARLDAARLPFASALSPGL